jgi:hypothetical protein
MPLPSSRSDVASGDLTPNVASGDLTPWMSSSRDSQGIRAFPVRKGYPFLSATTIRVGEPIRNASPSIEPNVSTLENPGWSSIRRISLVV